MIPLRDGGIIRDTVLRIKQGGKPIDGEVREAMLRSQLLYFDQDSTVKSGPPPHPTPTPSYDFWPPTNISALTYAVAPGVEQAEFVSILIIICCVSVEMLFNHWNVGTASVMAGVSTASKIDEMKSLPTSKRLAAQIFYEASTPGVCF